MDTATAKMVVALALATLWGGYGVPAHSTEQAPGTSPSEEDPPANKTEQKPPEDKIEDPAATALASGESEPVASEADNFAPEIVAGEGIRIVKIRLARGVNRTKTDRVPVEPGTTFENDGRRIYVFLEVDNPNLETGNIAVGWLPPGNQREQGTVSVAIKAVKRWRTWAFNAYIGAPGVWHAVVRNEAGEVIARAPFEITAVDPADGTTVSP